MQIDDAEGVLREVCALAASACSCRHRGSMPRVMRQRQGRDRPRSTKTTIALALVSALCLSTSSWAPPPIISDIICRDGGRAHFRHRHRRVPYCDVDAQADGLCSFLFCACGAERLVPLYSLCAPNKTGDCVFLTKSVPVGEIDELQSGLAFYRMRCRRHRGRVRPN